MNNFRLQLKRGKRVRGEAPYSLSIRDHRLLNLNSSRTNAIFVLW